MDFSSLRTLPHHHFFTDGKGIGQENLFNVLKAYSLYVHLASRKISSADRLGRYDPDVGYCQGLPFIVAILLLNVRLLLGFLTVSPLTIRRCQTRKPLHFS